MTWKQLQESAAALRAAGKLHEAADVLDGAARLDRAAALAPLQELLHELAVEDIGLHWRYIPGGTFTLGDDFGDLDERPARSVTLPGFLMTEAPIATDDITVAFPTYKSHQRYWDGAGTADWSRLNQWFSSKDPRPLAERTPLVAVTEQAARRIAHSFDARLPTEAEWERAARGCFVDAKYPWGDSEPTASLVDWDALGQRRKGPLPSRSFAPNDYGLFAMAGGVWERCLDVYDLLRAPADNNTASVRDVIRGGSFVDDKEALRVSFRGAIGRSVMSPVVGLRLVRDVVRPPPG